MSTVVQVIDADGRQLTVIHKDGLLKPMADGSVNVLDEAYEEIADYLLANNLSATVVRFMNCLVIGNKWVFLNVNELRLNQAVKKLQDVVMTFEGPDEWNIVARVRRADARAWLANLVVQKMRERKHWKVYRLYDFIKDHAAPGYPYVARLRSRKWALYLEDVWTQACELHDEMCRQQPQPRSLYLHVKGVWARAVHMLRQPMRLCRPPPRVYRPPPPLECVE